MTKTTSPQLGRFANVKLDTAFKRAFTRKRLLILFLNELIPERDIVDLDYAPQEQVNPFPGMKDIRVDVTCVDSQGRRFVVEMQRAAQVDFYDRAIFNSSFAVQQQIPAGHGAYSFPAVYFIGIMDFTLHPDDSRFLYRYLMREYDSGEALSEHFQMLFLELPNAAYSPKQALWKSLVT